MSAGTGSQPAIHVAPSEPIALKAIGKSSSMSEKFGADLWWVAGGKLWGVQRKELKDLLASVEDGRLTREMGMMTRLDYAFLIVEGWPRFADGQMLGDGWGRPWTEAGFYGMLLGIEQRGVSVWRTENLAGTIRWVQTAEEWSRKAKHSSLRAREGIGPGKWGRPTNREYAVYVMTSFGGVGPELAGRIFDTYGLPLRWTVGVEELMALEGIGKKKAEMIVKALETGEGDRIR